MEDDFELVSKEKIRGLREENKRLKKELESRPTIEESRTDDKKNQELVSQIIKELHKESTKEREFILANLNDIKDLNKSTLDNLLIKTQDLDTQLEAIIDTFSNVIDSFKSIVDNNSLQGSESNDLKEVITRLDLLSQNSVNSTHEDYNANILNKLNEIDTFMKNLRILLSYIKPNDFTIDKK